MTYLVDQYVIWFLGGLLCWAAYSDFSTYMIPNRISLAIVALYPAHILASATAVDWTGGLLTGAIVLTVGFALYFFKWFGAGDAKLIAATAVWAGPALILPFVFFTALAGGGISMVILARQKYFGVRPATGPTSDDATSPGRPLVPYGVAIAMGGLFLVSRLFVA